MPNLVLYAICHAFRPNRPDYDGPGKTDGAKVHGLHAL